MLFRSQLMHLAIVNDGFGARDSIKIYVNGVQYKTNLAEGSKRCWKEVVRDRPIDWRIFRAKELHWEELQLFRLRLSVPELKGFAEGTGSFDWEEMSEGERLDWVEHYAMRVDPDWRYQRETRGHYAANLAAILESESMLPVLARDVTRVLIEHKERFPLSLFREDWMASGARGAKDSNEQAFFIAMADWRWNEEGDTDRLDRLAKSEIQRSWWGIESSRVAYVQKRFGLKEEPAPLKDATEAELVQFLRSNWDREQLIERLLKLSLSSGR